MFLLILNISSQNTGFVIRQLETFSAYNEFLDVKLSSSVNVSLMKIFDQNIPNKVSRKVSKVPVNFMF